MAAPVTVTSFGNQLRIKMSDGTTYLAYETQGLWRVTGGGGGVDPEPGTGLTDYFTPNFSFEGDWEAHASYSRGGTDWGMAVGTGLQACASGTIVNYPDVDGAGLKSMLVFDTPFPRKLPASGTLMDGTYVENGSADAVAFMYQHLSSQLPEGHYNSGDVCCISGNTGVTTGPHLHGHLLATPTVGGDRLDFMKFV